MYKQRVLLIDYKTFKKLKEEIRSEEEYYNFLKKEDVEYIAIYHWDEKLEWVNKEDFLLCKE